LWERGCKAIPQKPVKTISHKLVTDFPAALWTKGAAEKLTHAERGIKHVSLFIAG